MWKGVYILSTISAQNIRQVLLEVMGFKAEGSEISAENIYTTYNFTIQNLFHVSNMGLQEICQNDWT